jgi:hypothetical protein
VWVISPLFPLFVKEGLEPAPACLPSNGSIGGIKQGGDFINQSTFHNVIPAAFLSYLSLLRSYRVAEDKRESSLPLSVSVRGARLDSCQLHAGMTYLRTFSRACYYAKFLYLIQNLFSFDTRGRIQDSPSCICRGELYVRPSYPWLSVKNYPHFYAKSPLMGQQILNW